jgi:hypothetical protein
MYAKMALALTMLLAMPSLGLADMDRSVESPEAFQAICDKAMPDLLQGKVPDALRKVTPDARVDAMGADLRTKLEPLRAAYGAPVDWVCAGARKRGDMLCQFVYLCRHDQGVVVWRLSAVEVKGRWCLADCHFDSNLAGLLSQAPAAAPDNDSPYARLGDKMADLIVHSRSEAVETMKANSVLHDSAVSETIRRGVEQAMALVLIDGGVVKCGAVDTQSVGGVLALRSYCVQCERGTIQMSFIFYRPGDDWKVLGCLFRPVTSADDLFAGAPLEGAEALAASHTARAAKPAGTKDAKLEPR